MAIRVLLADVDSTQGEAVRDAILRAADLDLLGPASSGREAVRLAIELRPDVLVAGTHLHQPSSYELSRYLKLRLPGLAVLLLTEAESEAELYEALRVGVAAYLPSALSAERLIDAIRRVGRGQYPIDDVVLTRPRVAAQVLTEFRELSAAKELEPLLAPLSPREIEILDHAARGHSNKQIARHLSISDQTVKNHISSILRKLAVNDRTEAVVFALRNGWIRI